ncbi:MAG: MBOAT family O-acyltransferase [Planctomycetota bacterium]
MIFNSYLFIGFLAINLAVYWTLKSWTARKLQLLIASYLFYAAWNPPFVLLLLLSTAVDYALGKRLQVTESQSIRRTLLAASLLVNLGMLAWFKYASFFLASLVDLLHAIGIEYAPPQLDLVLPVGISFYTFQTLSYTIDLYRRRIDASRSLLDFAVYVSFFPQLVAGPIVRASEFLHQLKQPPTFRAAHRDWGITLIVLGLFQKVVLADSLVSRVADAVYAHTGPLSTADAWLGTIAFAWQILFDFAGYSTIAIGVAMLFGFGLPRNFHWPYAASGFSDFWRRWHISLSGWLRDYLYIPLGGNRGSTIATSRNLLLTMLLGGLWHGAAWTFVAWGGIHGVLLITERRLREASSVFARCLDQGWAIPVTFPIVCVTWVFFRANDFVQASTLLSRMFLLHPGMQVLSLTDAATISALTLVGLMVSIWFRNQTLEDVWSQIPRPVAAMIVIFMALMIFSSPGDNRAFIYFQF